MFVFETSQRTPFNSFYLESPKCPKMVLLADSTPTWKVRWIQLQTKSISKENQRKAFCNHLDHLRLFPYTWWYKKKVINSEISQVMWASTSGNLKISGLKKPSRKNKKKVTRFYFPFCSTSKIPTNPTHDPGQPSEVSKRPKHFLCSAF